MFRPSRGRAYGVKLTDDGEAVARGLCGLSGLDAGLEILRAVAHLAATPEHWVLETGLAGVQYGDHDCKRKLMAVEDRALPALSRSWVESGSSVRGHVWYRVTTRGREILEKGYQFPEVVEVPKRDEGAARPYYFGAMSEEATRLAGPKRDPREIGLLPLPVSFSGAEG